MSRRSRVRREHTKELLAQLDALIDTTGCERDHRSTLESGAKVTDLLARTILAVKKRLELEEQQPAAQTPQGAECPTGPSPSNPELERLRDPRDRSQVHPRILTSGLQGSKSIAIFAIDVTSDCKIIHWNAGMEELSLPGGMVRHQHFRAFIEHADAGLLDSLKAFCSRTREGGVNSQSTNIYLKVAQFERRGDAMMLVSQPLLVHSLSAIRNPEHSVVLFTADPKAANRPPSFSTENMQVLSGVWRFADSGFQPMQAQMTGDTDSPQNMHRMLSALSQQESSNRSSFGGFAKLYGDISGKLQDYAFQSISYHYHIEDFSSDQYFQMHCTLQMPRMLGGFRLPWHRLLFGKMDGVIRRVPDQPNRAVSISLLKTDQSRILHDWALTLYVWHFKDDAALRELKVAEREAIDKVNSRCGRRNCNTAWPGGTGTGSVHRDNSKLDDSAQTEQHRSKSGAEQGYYVICRLNWFLSNDGERMYVENWFRSKNDKNPSKKIAYHCVKVEGVDLALTCDSLDDLALGLDE